MQQVRVKAETEAGEATDMTKREELKITATVAMVHSDIKALVSLCAEIGKQAGIEELNGLPIIEWFVKERTAELSKTLVEIENASPALAAALQQLIDGTEEQEDQKPKRKKGGN